MATVVDCLYRFAESVGYALLWVADHWKIVSTATAVVVLAASLVAPTLVLRNAISLAFLAERRFSDAIRRVAVDAASAKAEQDFVDQLCKRRVSPQD